MVIRPIVGPMMVPTTTLYMNIYIYARRFFLTWGGYSLYQAGQVQSDFARFVVNATVITTNMTTDIDDMYIHRENDDLFFDDDNPTDTDDDETLFDYGQGHFYNQDAVATGLITFMILLGILELFIGFFQLVNFLVAHGLRRMVAGPSNIHTQLFFSKIKAKRTPKPPKNKGSVIRN